MSAKKPAKAKTKSKAPKTTKPRKSAKSKVTASNVRDAQATNSLIERKGISLWHPAAIVSTMFSVGRIPYAPGTWGSLTGVVYFPLFLILPVYVGRNTENVSLVALISLALLAGLYCLGVMAAKTYQGKTRTNDAPEIVYDEFFGQILTYSIITAFVVVLTLHYDYIFPAVNQTQIVIYQFVPFLFFRLFDICKPWPINIVDKMENSAWGIMFDDVLAAFYAAAASMVVFVVMAN